MKKRILGFAHYRTDLGDGVRTGVYFGSCSGNCSYVCLPSRFPREHFFLEEEPLEALFYTEEELSNYLLREKLMYYSKHIGVSFLGKEPLCDSSYCRRVAVALKKAGISLHVWSCGLASRGDYSALFGLCDLFVIRLFSPITPRHKPFPDFSAETVLDTLRFLNAKKAPFRIYIPVLKGVNEDSAGALSAVIEPLDALKSVILDFSRSTLSEDEKRIFKDSFKKKGIVLY
ncbi:MAG: hypothetical protein IKC69_01615 [Clostridia bacterium]|nr:hypothetical protein [Clostridia bacterium]